MKMKKWDQLELFHKWGRGIKNNNREGEFNYDIL
jgi:hypothetical protein